MIYFDNAATTRFKPRSVLTAVKRTLKHSANPGRSSHGDSIRAALLLQETREAILSFTHATGHYAVFTKNCTEALNLALLGTAKLGGHVVTTAFEHNSVLRPLYMLKKEGLISLTVVEPSESGTIEPEAIEDAICEKTYLIAVTGMSNVTGYIPPLAKIGDICAKYGVLFAVDGAQALGHIPIDVEKLGIDFLCGSGHKGLHAAPGTGFLVANKKQFINPLMYGGTGTESNRLTQPLLPPESLESGTVDSIGVASLQAGIVWTEKHFDEISSKISDISYFLHKELQKNKGVRLLSIAGSPLVTFDLENRSNAAVADRLDGEFHIGVRYGLHCAPLIHRWLGTEKRGLIRAGIGVNNTHRDARALLRAINRITEQ